MNHSKKSDHAVSDMNTTSLHGPYKLDKLSWDWRLLNQRGLKNSSSILDSLQIAATDGDFTTLDDRLTQWRNNKSKISNNKNKSEGSSAYTNFRKRLQECKLSVRDCLRRTALLKYSYSTSMHKVALSCLKKSISGNNTIDNHSLPSIVSVAIVDSLSDSKRLSALFERLDTVQRTVGRRFRSARHVASDQVSHADLNGIESLIATLLALRAIERTAAMMVHLTQRVENAIKFESVNTTFEFLMRIAERECASSITTFGTGQEFWSMQQHDVSHVVQCIFDALISCVMGLIKGDRGGRDDKVEGAGIAGLLGNLMQQVGSLRVSCMQLASTSETWKLLESMKLKKRNQILLEGGSAGDVNIERFILLKTALIDYVLRFERNYENVVEVRCEEDDQNFVSDHGYDDFVTRFMRMIALPQKNKKNNINDMQFTNTTNVPKIKIQPQTTSYPIQSAPAVMTNVSYSHVKPENHPQKETDDYLNNLVPLSGFYIKSGAPLEHIVEEEDGENTEAGGTVSRFSVSPVRRRAGLVHSLESPDRNTDSAENLMEYLPEGDGEEEYIMEDEQQNLNGDAFPQLESPLKQHAEDSAASQSDAVRPSAVEVPSTQPQQLFLVDLESSAEISPLLAENATKSSLSMRYDRLEDGRQFDQARNEEANKKSANSNDYRRLSMTPWRQVDCELIKPLELSLLFVQTAVCAIFKQRFDIAAATKFIVEGGIQDPYGYQIALVDDFIRIMKHRVALERLAFSGKMEANEICMISFAEVRRLLEMSRRAASRFAFIPTACFCPQSTDAANPSKKINLTHEALIVLEESFSARPFGVTCPDDGIIQTHQILDILQLAPLHAPNGTPKSLENELDNLVCASSKLFRACTHIKISEKCIHRISQKLQNKSTLLSLNTENRGKSKAHLEQLRFFSRARWRSLSLLRSCLAGTVQMELFPALQSFQSQIASATNLSMLEAKIRKLSRIIGAVSYQCWGGGMRELCIEIEAFEDHILMLENNTSENQTEMIMIHVTKLNSCCDHVIETWMSQKGAFKSCIIGISG